MSLETLFQDIRYALRGLRGSPGFTLTAVTALSLGIGANTAVFSIVHALLFRAPAGVGDFDRVASVYTSDFSGPPYGSSSYLDIQDYASGAPSFSGIAAYSIQMAVLNDAAGGRPAELVGGQAVTGNYFDVLRIPMAAGRSFTAEERRPEGPSAVVLANAFWRTRFGGDPSVLGQTIRISGNPFTVVGVAPAGFNGLFAAVTPSFFVPIETSAPLFGIRLEERGARGLLTVGRLVDGATPERAGAELAVVAGRLFGAFPEAWTDRTSQQRRVTVIPTSQALLPPQARGAANAFAALLMGVVAAVLLICCANLANLLLVRATTRQREIGVRLALGAGRARIIRQLITESMVLAGAGVIGGVALAYAGTRALGNARLPLPIPVPVRIDATPDFRVLGFAVLVSLVAGVLFGLAPALIATRDAVASSIGTDRAIGGSSGRQMRLRYALAGGQIAIAVTLLVMAGLLVRSLRSAQAMDPGFRTAGMLFVNMAEDEKTTTPEQRLAFHRSLRDQVGALPGVRGVSYVSALPLGGGRGRRGYRAEGYTPAPQEEIEIDFTESGPGYLDAMGIQLRAGRDFAEADGPDAPRVAIVNESFARRYFAGTNPVGMRLNVGRPTEAEIVGVVADGKYRTLGEDPLPFVYVPLDQTSSPVVTLVIQAPGQLAGLDEAVRRLVSAEAPDVAITSVANADEHLSLALMPQRAGSAALGLFGLLGLALASLGVYGVTSYTVERRSHEIGVRLALGARRGDVVRMIVGKGMIVALVGAAVGLTAAAGLSQLLGFLLFGIEPLDAISFLGAGAIVAAACLLANWLPAQRSARLSPASILKGD